MTNRERIRAILHYEDYDAIPLVHLGFWNETLTKWREQGHVTAEEEEGWAGGNEYDFQIAGRLGLDYNWLDDFQPETDLFPKFDVKVVRDFADGTRHVRNSYGVVELHREGAGSIPAEISHTLVDRASWEKEYLPRLQYSDDRFDPAAFEAWKKRTDGLGAPYGLDCASLFGNIRNWLGIEGVSYLYADDEELYTEIIDTVADLDCRVTERVLQAGVKFDYVYIWEDICFKTGPLVVPGVFREKVGPHYRRLASLLRNYGVDIISLDCDGCIDSLVPIWFENGVNTMFPIEYGTWQASIAPWREKYGRGLLGVGGMNKNVFSRDYRAVDDEIERLKTLVALGGYLPCPDHRIAPDAKWENVQYYCDRMHKAFG
ncbi:MAG: hypothetical protein P4M02_05720 [Clostridia bacterium]|nr:hypothetical protein [Clostridia bacterium]